MLGGILGYTGKILGVSWGTPGDTQGDNQENTLGGGRAPPGNPLGAPGGTPEVCPRVSPALYPGATPGLHPGIPLGPVLLYQFGDGDEYVNRAPKETRMRNAPTRGASPEKHPKILKIKNEQRHRTRLTCVITDRFNPL